MTTRTGRPPGDPRTVIGLIFRIIDEPRRAACAVSILVLPLCVAAQVLGSGPVFGVPLAWIGGAGSVSGTAVLALLRRRARKRAGAATNGEQQ
ncbi:hypothetical protein ACWEVP_37395 [Amycolatopsis sp. NPDC003865]